MQFIAQKQKISKFFLHNLLQKPLNNTKKYYFNNIYKPLLIIIIKYQVK